MLKTERCNGTVSDIDEELMSRVVGDIPFGWDPFDTD